MCVRQHPTSDTPRSGEPNGPAKDDAACHALAVSTPRRPGDPFSRIAARLAPAESTTAGTAETPRTDPAGAVPPRRKLWDLDAGIHCAVMGTCLTMRELRQLMRKVSIQVDPNASDYDIHRAFVGISRKQGKASKLIHKQLDQKYRQPLRDCNRASTAKEMEQLWEEALCEGDVAGVFWALLTDPRTSPAMIDRIYGEIHMLSHLSGASVRIDLQELARTRRRLGDLETARSQSEGAYRQQLKRRDANIMTLEARIQALESELEARTDEVARLSVCVDEGHTEQLSALNQDLLRQLARGLKRLETSQDECRRWQRIAEQATDRNLRLETRLAEVRAEREALKNTLQPLLESCDTESECLGDACANKDLCGRCILYVGGRGRQCAHFRDLVERSNGRFLHHDGGREDNPRRLGSILSKADAVLCPLDCVSHDAVHRLKRLCESKAKRLILIPRASLASFARGLREVA